MRFIPEDSKPRVNRNKPHSEVLSGAGAGWSTEMTRNSPSVRDTALVGGCAVSTTRGAISIGAGTLGGIIGDRIACPEAVAITGATGLRAVG